MACPRCGIEVSEHQKFCHECGMALSATSNETVEPTELPDTTPANDGTTSVEPTDGAVPGPDQLEVTQQFDVTETFDESDQLEVTQQFDVTELFEESDELEVTQPIEQIGAETTEPDGLPDATEPVQLTAPPAPPAEQVPTERVEVVAAPVAAPVTAPVTAEMPALFDGHADLAEYPVPREPFRVRVIFLLAVFGAAAMLMAVLADVIDIRTTRPAPGIVTGQQTLEQLGTNLGVAGFVGTAVMVGGGLLACFGLRWGAGLAGGAGLALAGWAALTIGLAELPIAIAESITRTSSVPFTLRVTRDLGWWLILGVGVVGIVVFLASLRSIGSGGKAALNPLVAAVTAVAAVVLAFGPLVPVGDASFTDNFRSVDPTRDLPAAFFAGRLGQVGLIALAGVVGMLIVRSYGLGLAAGGVSVPVWLWATSLAEMGSDPVGIAYRNPGADTTVPHAVTTVGMVTTIALLLVAAALGTYRLTRRRSG